MTFVCDFLLELDIWMGLGLVIWIGNWDWGLGLGIDIRDGLIFRIGFGD